MDRINVDDNDLRNMFTAWMEKVVYHARIDYIRQTAAKARAKELVVPLECVDPSYEQDFRLESDGEFDFAEKRLAESFVSLPLMRRKILTLLFVEGMTALEIASHLHCSTDYVYQQKHRALQKLKEQLGGGDERGER